MELKRPNIDKLPPKLRHVSRWPNRDSILKYGLIPNIGKVYSDYWFRAYPGESLVPVIFLSRGIFCSTIKGIDKCFDVWEVKTEDLDLNYLYMDPAFENSRKLAYMYFKEIPADKLKLAKKSPYSVECAKPDIDDIIEMTVKFC